jgi:hypothetical protein
VFKLWSLHGLSVVPKLHILSIYTSSFHFHPVCGHFQVSVVSLGSVCGALTSDLVNLLFLLSFPTCLWSFSGGCGPSVVPKILILFIYTSSYHFHPVCGRCLWSVCGLSVVPKVIIMSIYTFSYRFQPVCGRFQVSVVCLWSVCGLSVALKVRIMSSYSFSYRFHPFCGRF